MFIAPQNLLIDHVDVVGRDKIIDDKILKLELFLQNSPSFLQIFDLFCIHLFKLSVFILKVFQSFYFLFDL